MGLLHVMAEIFQEAKSQDTSAYQISAWVTCADVPLATASHTPKT